MTTLFLRGALLALLLLAWVTGASARADTVQLHNGQVYQGKILNWNDDPNGKFVIDTMINGVRAQLTFNNQDVLSAQTKDLPADFFTPTPAPAPAATTAPTPTPAAAVAPAATTANAKQFVMNGNGTKNDDGVFVLTSGQRLTSVDTFTPPVAFKITAQTNSTNIRIGYAADEIIFNWEMKPTELRIGGGPANGQHKPGAGQIPVNQWVVIDLTVLPDSMTIAVDGQERHRVNADFSHVNQPLTIFPANGSTIEVKSASVQVGKDPVQTASFVVGAPQSPADRNSRLSLAAARIRQRQEAALARQGGVAAPQPPSTPSAGVPNPVVQKPLTEIDKAWSDAEIDTLNDAARQRDRQVLATMRGGVESLLGLQSSWDRMEGGYPGGYTALNTYALLHVGHAIDDPRLRFSSKELADPLDLLLKLDSKQTYVAALQASALELLPPRKEYLDPLRRVQTHLLVKTSGGYTYNLVPSTASGRGTFDNSNTQYDNLGVWATQDAGLEVPLDYWRIAENHWRTCQSADGGWDYNGVMQNSTFTMTSAALASLFTVSWSELSDKSPYRDPQIQTGFTQLAKFLDTDNGAYGGRDGYGLYGMERVGLASGFKRFGTHDWYAEGADSVLRGRMRISAYVLLFLTRGRNPVLLNKLRYNGDWDVHPWDSANLAKWMTKTFEQPFNWQIITADSPEDDWMDSPLLLITGERPFPTDAALIAKLQAYIDAGGTVFSTSEKGSVQFTTFIRSLANRVCRGRYEMRDLPPDHLLFTLDYKLKNPSQLMGLSNGVREVWIHSPADLGAVWQRYGIATADSWSIPANIVLYINGKSVMRRRMLLVDPSHITPPADGTPVTVGQLEYAGNWQPEPGAWPLLGLWAADSGLKVTSQSTDAAHLADLKPTILYMTGTTRFTPTDDMRTALAAYVAGGGTILADAAGGRPEFTTSFTDMAKQIFPNQVLQPIPPDDPLQIQGTDDQPPFRRSWILQNGNVNQSRLWGVKIGDRWAVIFSPDDIATGFLGTNTWGVQGYTPDASRQLTGNILRYAIKTPPQKSP